MMDDATRKQIAAARPDRSTWLSANAGSGKTRVLTDRVARLLLRGTSPQSILCLTYTKAAASEMQNRLFRRLGDWAMASDPDLRERLVDLGEPPDLVPDALARARRLFARAIETPGGLRIQTIHSFCAHLLRRFPLEAGVSPQFTEMDDRAVARLAQECLERVALDDPDVMAKIAPSLDDMTLPALLREITARRESFRGKTDHVSLADALDLSPDANRDRLLSDVFTPDCEDLLADLAEAMRHGAATDQKSADDVACLGPPWSIDDLVRLEKILLTGSGAKAPFTAKVGKVPSKAARDVFGPANQTALDALMDRVEAGRSMRLALDCLDRTVALHDFARAYLPVYSERKAARGWLDFDDLILRTRDLLTAPGVADWVLYRLDGGIEHILVDEAQDTSPTQWQVIDALSAEIAAGHGAEPDRPRTIFVVGDRKQSIYSFQGADPAEFDRMQHQFRGKLADGALQRSELQHSFRSSTAILDLVDAVFSKDDLDPTARHIAFHGEMPGRVDLWPLIEPEDTAPDPEWSDPVDRVSPRDASISLAEAIAGHIRDLIDRNETIATHDGRRRLHEGDFLILTRQRGPLFHAIIRSLKRQGLAIAGADRLRLGEQLAVRDILALLSFLSTPEDDLSLATVLRSPLGGWSEAELFRLAQPRGGRYLWQALRERKTDATVVMLQDLLAEADFLRPYELIERVLTLHQGRARLLGRLGDDQQEAIDALLGQALAYERVDVPSLTGFLSWITAEDIEIKRQAESAGRQIRVMTVHGAKGLEAPVVILPETMKRPEQDRATLVPLENGPIVWRMAKDASPSPLAREMDRRRAAADAERARLLYVAMTRAERWLIICGHGNPSDADGRWYDQISAGLESLPTHCIDTPAGTGKRHAPQDWGSGLDPAPVDRVFDEPYDPGDLDTIPVIPPRPDRPLGPSTLGGSKALPGDPSELSDDPDRATRRGTAIHALLEHLPLDRPEDWNRLAPRLLGTSDETLSTEEIDEILKEVHAVLTDRALAALFAEPALLEVGVTAPHPSGRPVFGTIDRLIVREKSVLAVDYKSNRLVPRTAEETPDGLLRQMGAYAFALARIYPQHRIETAILWTTAPRLMPLPDELTARAFAAAVAA